MFKYSLNISIGDFHHIYNALLDKQRHNEKEIANLVTVNDFFEDEEIIDQEKYDALITENKELHELAMRLFKETNSQL